MPFNIFRKKQKQKENLTPTLESVQVSSNVSESSPKPGPVNPPIEPPVQSSYSAWLNDLSYLLAWLTEQANQWLDYFYPESWKTLKDYTPEELEVLKRQTLDQKARQELRSALLDRQSALRVQYNKELSHLTRKQKLFSNWFEANKQDLANKKKFNEAFNPPPGSNYREMPGWEPEQMDVKRVNADLCHTLQCSGSDPITISSDPAQTFESQMRLREMQNQNFEIQKQLEYIQGEYQKCVDYVNNNEPFVQPIVRPEKTPLEIGAGDRIFEMHSQKPVSTPSISNPLIPEMPPSFMMSNLFLDQEITFFEALVHCLFIPIRIATGEISLGTQYIRGGLQRFFLAPTIRLIAACLLLFCYYQIIVFVSMLATSLLESALSYLPKKKSAPTRLEILNNLNNLNNKSKKKNQRSKSKKQFRDEDEYDEDDLDETEESNNFWDRHLGRFGQVIKILRGGELVPIREANIYEFSELDRQHALLFCSPIPAWIRIQRQLLELDKLLLEFKQIPIQSKQTPTLRKRLGMKVKNFYSRLTKVPSNLKEVSTKLKEVRISYKVRVFLCALFILGGGATGTSISNRTRNRSESASIVRTQPIITSVLPRIQPTIVQRETPSMMIQMQESPKISPRLKSAYRSRKKAKLVRFSDLPSLAEQDFGLELDSTPIARPTSIKIRLD